MLYLFHGTNQKKIQEQAQAVVESLRAKREFAQVFYIHADTFNVDNIEGQQNAQGLFFDKHIFVYKHLLSGVKESREYVLGNLEKYIESPHLHLIVENEVDEKYLKEFEKNKNIIVKKFAGGAVELKKEDISKKMFSTVGLIADLKSMDSLQKTSAKKIQVWKQVDDIRNVGTTPEEFFGILWWKYKTLMQARGTDQKESGLAPYSYTQAKKSVDMYAKKGIDSLQKDMSFLLTAYHDAHNGESDMWESLEGWVLG